MNKLFSIMLGLALLCGSAAIAAEPVAKDTKAPEAVKKAVKVKKAKTVKKTVTKVDKAAAAAETKAPAAEPKK